MVRATKAIFSVVLSAFLLPLSTGCSEGKPPSLDDADKRFAAFYADYLLYSGVAADDADSGISVKSEELDSLLATHGLSAKDFNERADTYRIKPKLWKAVLTEVRDILQKHRQ